MPAETTQEQTAQTAEELAAVALGEVVARLSQPGTNLRLTIRRCMEACSLLGWEEAADWLRSELLGYRADQPVPWYRHNVPAYVDWRPPGLHDLIANMVEEGFRRLRSKPAIARDVRYGFDDLISYAAHGVYVRTGQRATKWSTLDKKDVELEEVEIVENTAFQRLLSQLEDELLSWAARAYKAVRFGDAAGDVWRAHRSRVDQFATNAGLFGHIGLINQGLSSGEPQAWRQAMWSCRDLLRDLATHLWRDSRKTYRHLPGEDGQPMKVTPDKYINRLCAYLHQKGLTGSTGAYLRAELARLHALNDLDSVAHDRDAVTLEDARLAVIATYTVLGEFVQRTDMAPVQQYG